MGKREDKVSRGPVFDDYVSLLKPPTNGGVPERVEAGLKKGMLLGCLDEVWADGSSPYSIFFLKIENAIREWKSDPNSEVVVVDSVAPALKNEDVVRPSAEKSKREIMSVVEDLDLLKKFPRCLQLVLEAAKIYPDSFVSRDEECNTLNQLEKNCLKKLSTVDTGFEVNFVTGRCGVSLKTKFIFEENLVELYLPRKDLQKLFRSCEESEFVCSMFFNPHRELMNVPTSLQYIDYRHRDMLLEIMAYQKNDLFKVSMIDGEYKFVVNGMWAVSLYRESLSHRCILDEYQETSLRSVKSFVSADPGPGSEQVVDSVAPGCNVEFDFKKTLEFRKKTKITMPPVEDLPPSPVLYSEEFKENTLKKAFESAKSWPRLGEVIANGIPGIKFYDHRSSGLKKPTGFELPENVWYFLSKSKHACGCSFQVKSYVSAFGWGRKEVHAWYKEMDHLFAKANQECPVARHGDDFEVTGTHEHWVWVELANREKNKPEILFT